MLSAIALEDLFWQEMEYFPKILFNISFVALLAFVLDKLQTVRAVSSVKHQDLRQSLVKIKFRNTEKLKIEKVKVVKITFQNTEKLKIEKVKVLKIEKVKVLTSQTSPSSPSAAGSAAASSVTTSASGISPSVRPGQKYDY